MGFMDNMRSAAKKSVDAAKSAQEYQQARNETREQENLSKGILLQLKSLEGTVTLLDKHVEIRNLLGSKVRNVPYTQIEAVYVDKTSALGKGTAALFTAGMSLAVTNKKKFTISTGEDKFKLEFRTEPLAKVRRAMDIINKKINSKYSPTINITQAGTAEHSDSAADAVAKFAKLRDEGIITEEEFQGKKKQLLGL